MTEYDSLVPPIPEAHSNSCITLNVVICLPCILLPNQFHFFFFPLKLPRIGFYHLRKKNPISPSRRRFFFQLGYDLFFLFQIPPHYLWEGRKTPWACKGICNEIQKTHASKWKEYRGIVASTPVQWNERREKEDWFASSLTWKEKRGRTQWPREPPPLTYVIVSKQQDQLG